MSIRSLFEPRGVVVAGSMTEGKLGFELVRQILLGGYTNVYAVNPRGEGALSAPGFRSAAEIDAPVDLAVIASPAPTVAGVLEDIGQKGAGAAVVISSGFGEVGNHAGEEEILRVARRYGIRLVGPNCAGIANTAQHLFATLETRPPAGKTAFISQSGALGGAVLSWAEEQGVGISKFVSYGNRADLDEIELLPYLAEDPETAVAALYIETVSDGRRFMEAVSSFCRVKPLVVIKSGRSHSGQRAALSHTGSMAGSDRVYEAALKASGAIRVETIEEMFDLCKGFTCLPPVRGRRIAIVTNSGGPGILAADRAESRKLFVSEPGSELREQLREKLPPYCALGNPIDLTVQGSRENYRDSLELALGSFDAALAINVATPYLDSVELARGIVEGAQGSGKPVLASFMAGKLVAEGIAYLREHGVPNYTTGEHAVDVLARMAGYEEHKRAPRPEQAPPSPLGALPRTPEGWFLEPQAMAWLRQNGIPVPEFHAAATPDEAVKACREIGYPVVMKVVSPDILHKSEVGGVVVGVQDDAGAQQAFQQLELAAAGKTFCGVIVYPQIRDAQEVLLGCTRDAKFGPVVMLGAGGIYTEILRDTSVRVAPVDRDEAERMVRELKSYPILSGARGQTPRDLAALANLIARFSELPFLYPEIAEIDLNPVFLFEQGLLVGDVRVISGG